MPGCRPPFHDAELSRYDAAFRAWEACVKRREFIAWVAERRRGPPKPHEINNWLVSLRFRSSLRRVPQDLANFGIGTLAAFWLLVLAPASPAGAETGPCVSDQAGVMTCGQGPGAARVVDGTTSPSNRLAFAWRAPSRPPTEPPDEAGNSLFTVESLLIRLSDGVVLSSARGEYWRTGDAQANHIDESVAWSPNSRLAIEMQDSKWSTDVLRLYAIGMDDKVLVFDLQKIIEPAVRKRIRQLGKNDRIYTFSVEDSTVDDSGLVRASVLMQIPKQEGEFDFDVALQVSEKNGALSAGDVSVRRSRTKS